ncbi:hypothetical protein LTR85_001122 [Meristemomyces frigidus]|nr:hypothetical protein LTR85_001122 [Meristemomyces frigidus]
MEEAVPEVSQQTLLPKMVKLDFSETLTVLVGETKQVFTVHKDIISRRSSFFKAACHERWQGASTAKDVELPTDDPELFGTYLQCVYTDTVVTHQDSGHNSNSDDDDISTLADCVMHLVKVYFLADKLGDLISCNLIIDSLITTCKERGVSPRRSASLLESVYESTPKNSPLRRLMVDYHIHHVPSLGKGGMEFVDDVDLVPRAFLVEVLQEYGRLKAECCDTPICAAFGDLPSQRAKCHYHQHDERHPRCE